MYLKSSVLRLDTDSNDPESVIQSRVYKRVGRCLGNIFEAEVKAKSNPALWVNSVEAVAKLQADFEKLLKCYACLDGPFSAKLLESQTALQWWRSLEKSKNASVLAVCKVPRFMHIFTN